MVRSALSHFVGRGVAPGFEPVSPDVATTALTTSMFDVDRTKEEASKAVKLERLYHKGQNLAWRGQETLEELVARHGRPSLPPEQARALRRLFAVILWGELAAWKISADLALRLGPLEAKMAATQQAHDEARHFYVMHDYLALLGHVPTDLGPAARRVLDGTLQANNLAKKLLGMQMMIEPMALTLFQVVRERRIEPVLADLLVLYERDEARHVALGVLHLPELLRGATVRDAADLYRWQLSEYFGQFAMLRELADAFAALDIDPRAVVELGRDKQLLAARMLVDEMGTDWPMVDVFRRITDARIELEWPKSGASNRKRDRVLRAVQRAVSRGVVEGELSNVATAS
jgi:hypothetical protein